MCDRLLNVDDDVLFAKLLARAMRKRGFETCVAYDCGTACALIAQNELTHAIVDLRLGSGNGLEVVEALRASRTRARCIVLTGYGNLKTAAAAIRLGASEYLAKPTDADEIEAFLRPDHFDWSEYPPKNRRPEEIKLEHVLEVYERNVSETARQLSMHRRSLQRYLERNREHSGYGIDMREVTRFGRSRRIYNVLSEFIEPEVE